MQELIDQVRQQLRTMQAEQSLVATGHADRVAGGSEGAAKRAAVMLKTCEAKLQKAQDVAKASATAIVKEIDAARDRVAKTCRETARITGYEGTCLEGYPGGPTGPNGEVPRVNGSPFHGLLAGVSVGGVFRTDLAKQMADAAGLCTDQCHKPAGANG